MEKSLRAVYFAELSEKTYADHGAAVTAEMERTLQALRAAGFESGIRFIQDGPPEQLLSAEAGQDVLFLCGSPEILSALRSEGRFAAGYSNDENPGAAFPGASYILQEPDLVDRDSYCKIYEREAGLPWTILRTPHCLVREFTEDDLDGIYALYDDAARRFLEPPSEDRAHEQEILRAYIKRIYGLYGFGHWAVLSPAVDGALIGRIGFAALSARQEQEALALGIHEPGDRRSSGIDADFGFLVAAPYRGTGIAEEVCRALLEYGFSQLGFRRVRADARRDNEASIRLLRKLGFRPVGNSQRLELPEPPEKPELPEMPGPPEKPELPEKLAGEPAEAKTGKTVFLLDAGGRERT